MAELNSRTAAAAAIRRLSDDVIAMDNPSVVRCEFVLSGLNAKFRVLEEAQATLVARAASAAELDGHDQFLIPIQRVHDEAVITLQEYLHRARRDDSITQLRSTTSSTTSETRLERIKIKPFDGQPDNWPRFYNRFLTMVHEREDLSNATKLAHLEQCVDPTKVPVLDHAFDYERTWAELKHRYDKPDQLADGQVHKLGAMPIGPKETRGNIFAVIDVVRTCLRVFQKQGNDEDYGNKVLYPLIMERLPVATQTYVKLQYEGRDVTTLLEKIGKYAETLPLLRDDGGWRSDNSRPVNRSRSFVAVNGTACQWCNENHEARECNMFRALSPAERKRRATHAGACYMCLKVGHRVSDCRADRCRQCGGSHHTMLCFGGNERGGVPSMVAPSPSTSH